MLLMAVITLKSLDRELEQNVLEIALDHSNLSLHRAALPGKVPNTDSRTWEVLCTVVHSLDEKMQKFRRICLCTTQGLKDVSCFIGGNTMTK